MAMNVGLGFEVDGDSARFLISADEGKMSAAEAKVRSGLGRSGLAFKRMFDQREDGDDRVKWVYKERAVARRPPGSQQQAFTQITSLLVELAALDKPHHDTPDNRLRVEALHRQSEGGFRMLAFLDRPQAEPEKVIEASAEEIARITFPLYEDETDIKSYQSKVAEHKLHYGVQGIGITLDGGSGFRTKPNEDNTGIAKLYGHNITMSTRPFLYLVGVTAMAYADDLLRATPLSVTMAK